MAKSDDDWQFYYWSLLAWVAKSNLIFCLRKKPGGAVLAMTCPPEGNIAPPDEKAMELIGYVHRDIMKMLQDREGQLDYIDLIKDHGLEVWPGFPYFTDKQRKKRDLIEMEIVKVDEEVAERILHQVRMGGVNAFKMPRFKP